MTVSKTRKGFINSMHKYVYLFSEGNGSMRELLGGKGANLAEMTNLGMPVPQGFTISTEACTKYYEDDRNINDEIKAQVYEALARIEKINGKKFGDAKNPLLVSVRSGARASMPGMMDTILNLGLNDEVAAGLIAGNPTPAFTRFVYDSYRRFIQMFSDVVMELSKKTFEVIIDEVKAAKGVKNDIDLDADDMKKLVDLFKAHYKEEKGEDFPTDPAVQLMEAIKAVFRSWDNPRANVYRRMNDIPYSWGTAVNVQPMVFGNLNDKSGTGVAFTRDPATGEKALFGEYLINAQGEDVVAGIRTPSKISKLHEEMPAVYDQFADIANRLENHYRDMQDMEFTIENGKLYMLQTRNGKRTAAAALKIACDLVDEGMISREEAVMRQRFDFVFLHVDCAEDKVHHRSDLLHVGSGVEDNHVFHGFRHGRAHGPAVSHSLLIGFAGGPAARSERFDVKPGMIFQERCKPLAYHAGCSDDSNLICFHDTFPPI